MSIPEDGSGHCYWFQRTQAADALTPAPDPNFFGLEEHDTWILGTFASLPLRPLSIDPNVVFDEWVLFQPNASGSDTELVVYTRQHTSGMQAEPGFDPTLFGHFDCLSPNTFYYQGTEGDHGGEDDPTIWGWPPTLTITPYYFR